MIWMLNRWHTLASWPEHLTDAKNLLKIWTPQKWEDGGYIWLQLYDLTKEKLREKYSSELTVHKMEVKIFSLNTSWFLPLLSILKSCI